MSLSIVDTPLVISLHGLGGEVINEAYAQTGMQRMTEMWRIVREQELKNKGINYWVYDSPSTLFTGVELEQGVSPAPPGLEFKEVRLGRHARWKHVGPYSLLPAAYRAMKKEMTTLGIPWHHPLLEIYGHWSPDESKLETDLLFSID